MFSHRDAEVVFTQSDWRKEQHQWWKENIKGQEDD
jgi:hypothetical protein